MMKNSITKFRENKILKKLITRELSLIVGGVSRAGFYPEQRNVEEDEASIIDNKDELWDKL
jgi:hypothetical protein